MVNNNLENDLFGDQLKEVKGKKVSLLNNYSKQRFLPYVKIPIEYTVIIAIGVLVLMIVSYAIGVEKGKRSRTDKPSQQVSKVIEKTENVLSIEENASSERNLEQKSTISTSEPDKAASHSERIDMIEVGEDEDPYAGVREDYIGAPPEMEDHELEEKKDASSPYIIQLASFKSEGSARDEVRKLIWKGVEANYSKSGSWYQVYASGYQTMDEAKEAQEGLVDYYTDCYIRKLSAN